MMHVVRRPPGSPERLSGHSSQPTPDAIATVEHSSRASWWMDGDVAAMLLVFWIASVVRVVGAAMHHEVFGAEASLAFMSVVAVPWVLGRAVLRRRQGANVLPQSAARDGTPHEGTDRPALRLVRK
ncbi:MAG TPA: hypothetical protein VH044_01055 [Polyangiaceae bacterium]|jgi:hypothetical protein|nr:hypothetical protein [Polyangiaceae bacterium]